MSETKISRLLCQGCGADLDVSDEVRFATCNYCSAKLEVVRDDSTTHTRVLETIAEDVKVIRLQNDLEQLDREWETEKETYKISGKNGHRSLPTQSGSAIGGLFIVGVGIFWIIGAASMPSNLGGGVASFLPLFGVLFIVGGLVQSVRGFGKASEYQGAESNYQSRRSKLKRELAQAKRAE